MKICYTCKKEKSLSKFNKAKANKDGFQGSCKSCMSAYNKNRNILLSKRTEEDISKKRKGKVSKVCLSCGIDKLFSKYYKDKRTFDGLRSNCRCCQRVKSKEYYYRYPDYIKDRTKRYSSLPQQKDYMRKYSRKYRLRKKYNLSLKDWDRMYIKQNGRCYICAIHQDELGRLLVVDHHHPTGRVRKLLCPQCNAGLGIFKESPELLRSAADYIIEHSNEVSTTVPLTEK